MSFHENLSKFDLKNATNKKRDEEWEKLGSGALSQNLNYFLTMNFSEKITYQKTG